MKKSSTRTLKNRLNAFGTFFVSSFSFGYWFSMSVCSNLKRTLVFVAAESHQSANLLHFRDCTRREAVMVWGNSSGCLKAKIEVVWVVFGPVCTADITHVLDASLSLSITAVLFLIEQTITHEMRYMLCHILFWNLNFLSQFYARCAPFAFACPFYQYWITI